MPVYVPAFLVPTRKVMAPGQAGADWVAGYMPKLVFYHRQSPISILIAPGVK